MGTFSRLKIKKKEPKKKEPIQSSLPVEPVFAYTGASNQLSYLPESSANPSEQVMMLKQTSIPWFLSGVPEQYHEHCVEWMKKQPSGAPWDYDTYLNVSGVYQTGLQSNRCIVSGW